MLENDRILKSLLELFGYSTLYPPQEKALEAGIMEGRNLLVTTPTASGKTLIALMAISKTISSGGRAVYLTPLRALAAEKFSEIKKIESLRLERRINVMVSTGDYDSSAEELSGADVAILTNEKMDTIFRHGADWLGEVKLFVSDEVHLIGDKERGPALEMMLTRIRKFYPEAQIIALSATIANSKELARWLKCELVENNWRPTKLIEGVYDGGRIRTRDATIDVPTSGESASIDVAVDCLRSGGQSLIFAETRKRAVSLAARALLAVQGMLSMTQRELASKAAEEIIASEDDSETTRTLARLVEKGVAFHHAGLGPSSRQIVEDYFRCGAIRLLAATPTLAAGVNLPARRVVVASILRYDQEYGSNVPISVLEYKQLCGRAGRPKFDSFGEAVIISDSRLTADELYDHYVLGSPEPIRSQMSGDKPIRFHLLSAITMNPGMKMGEILDFFSLTLYALQNRRAALEFKISSSVEFLERERLVELKGNRYIATEFGKRVTLLYVDPMTAVGFRRALEGVKDDASNHTLGLLHLLTDSPDFFPKLALRRKDYEEVVRLIDSRSSELLIPITEYDVSRSFWALAEWIEETPDIKLGEVIGVEPGDIHRIVESASWLSHSLYEIARLIERQDMLQQIIKLRTRIRYGVKEELVRLVSLEGVGRVRARALYNAGFKDIGSIAIAPKARLAAVQKIGPAVAEKLKDQLKKKANQ